MHQKISTLTEAETLMEVTEVATATTESSQLSVTSMPSLSLTMSTADKMHVSIADKMMSTSENMTMSVDVNMTVSTGDNMVTSSSREIPLTSCKASRHFLYKKTVWLAIALRVVINKF